MSEGELLGVQKMSAEVAHTRANLRVLDRVVTSRAVRLITNNRMLQPREMNTDLVRAAGFQFNVEQREPIELLPHAIQRKCAASAAHNSHARAVRRIARQRLI